VIAYLDETEPEAAQRARARYACFDHFGRDPQVYAYAAGVGDAEPCEPQVVAQLLELHRLAAEKADGWIEFFAEQNARLVANAEEYYRTAFRGGAESWNLRDRHMAETLEALRNHVERNGGRAKFAVWAHNSHLGDARATEMSERGELNLGQLVRLLHPDETMLIGFTTYSGTVTAASEWGGAAERKRVRPALAGSWEALFHETGEARLLIDASGTSGRRLERAIGVICRPKTERFSHYFHARPRRPVRRRPPLRRDTGRAAPRAHERVAGGRAARDLSLGRLSRTA
jgi:erythromycin esterase-like protein